MKWSVSDRTELIYILLTINNFRVCHDTELLFVSRVWWYKGVLLSLKMTELLRIIIDV